MKTIAHTITTSVALSIVEQARDAEFCQDLNESRRTLEPLWPDIDVDPDFSSFVGSLNGELKRIAGYFLACYGRAKNKPDFQLRGKDLLTAAIAQFHKAKLRDSLAEAKIMLAFCYWQTGEVAEYDAILDEVEQEFAGDHFSPVYLRIQLNRLTVLTWKGASDAIYYQQALDLVNSLSDPVAFCRDDLLLEMFHNQIGVLCRQIGDYEKAVIHLEAATEKAKKIGHHRFLAMTLNCLAMTYKCMGRFVEAHENVDDAIDIFESMEDAGWLPHMLDTKALIYLDEARPDDALAAVNSAVDLFRTGEDYSGLTDSLWTRVRCLLKLGRRVEAFTVFGELQSIASRQIGEVAVTKYAKALAGEVYTLCGSSMPAETAEFKKTLVRRALSAANGRITAAASALGLKNHQTLSEMLNTQFPELYDELGIVRRTRGAAEASVSAPRPRRRLLSNIVRLVLPNYVRLVFDALISPTGIRTFYCTAAALTAFGKPSDAIIAVCTMPEHLMPGLPLMFVHNGSFGLALLQYEEMTRMFFVDYGGWLPLDEIHIVGSVAGLCAWPDVTTTQIRFRKL